MLIVVQEIHCGCDLAKTLPILCGLLVVLAGATATAKAAPVDFVSDFGRAGRDARPKGAFSVVLFTRRDCRYCRVVLERYLEPLMDNPEYQSRFVILQLDVEDERGIRDFSGNVVTPKEFAALQGVSLTPTVKFLGHDGRELARPIVGVSSTEYYGFLLWEAIDDATGKIGR